MVHDSCMIRAWLAHDWCMIGYGSSRNYIWLHRLKSSSNLLSNHIVLRFSTLPQLRIFKPSAWKSGRTDFDLSRSWPSTWVSKYIYIHIVLSWIPIRTSIILLYIVEASQCVWYIKNYWWLWLDTKNVQRKLTHSSICGKNLYEVRGYQPHVSSKTSRSISQNQHT